MRTWRALLTLGFVALLCGKALGADPAGAPATAPRSDLLHDTLFYVLAAVAAASCLGIVISTNIVRTTMWLFGVLGAIAALFFLMLANFLAVIQLIVYAGGILVLIVFGVMLTSKSPWIRFNPRPLEVIGGAVVSLALFGGLGWALLRADWAAAPPSGQRVFTVAEIGQALLTDYLIPFEVASMLLLAVMLGAAYLVRPEK